MEDHVTKHYKSIPIPPASLPSSDGDSSPESDDDHHDKSYKPRWPTGKNATLTMSDGMLHAMDDLLMLSMLLKGTTPELMATERQRQEEEEELCTKEDSQAKVQQWVQSSSCVFSLLGYFQWGAVVRLKRDVEFQSNTSHTTMENRLVNDVLVGQRERTL